MEDLKTLPFQVSQKIVDLALENTRIRKVHDEVQRAAHEALLDAVHEEYPELDEDSRYTLRCEFAEQGIVMLEAVETKGMPDPLKLLGKLLKDVN